MLLSCVERRQHLGDADWKTDVGAREGGNVCDTGAGMADET